MSPMSSRSFVTLGAIALASVLLACTDAASERAGTSEATVTTADPRGRPVTDEELVKITSHPEFADMREIIAERGGAIDLASGLVYTYVDGVSGTETRFGVSSLDRGVQPDLVFQDMDGERAFFYSVAQAEPLAARAQSRLVGGQANLFGCGGWSGWAFTGTHCAAHFWCFGQSQRGTYSTFTRSRQCKNGIQVQNNTNFVGCGC